MRLQRYLLLIMVGAICALCGCRSTILTRECYVDDLCDGGGFAVSHGQIFAIPTLKPNISKFTSVAIIAAYLRREPGACMTRCEYWSLVPDRIRSRDYWALVLAQIVNKPLQIMADDSDNDRDLKIDELLGDLNGLPN